MSQYVLEGKIHYGENLIFIETEKDENGNPVGTFLHELLENNIKDETDVVITIATKNIKQGCKFCKIRNTEGCPMTYWDGEELVNPTRDNDYCSHAEY